MNHLFVALDAQGYQQVKPIADKYLETHKLGMDKTFNRLPPGIDVNPHEIIKQEQELEADVWEKALEVAKNSKNFSDFDWEVTAYDDLKHAIRKVSPKADALLHELGELLITADKIKELYPQWIALLDSLNIEEVIKTKAEFTDRIPMSSYLSVLKKQKDMLRYCVYYSYALLNMVLE